MVPTFVDICRERWAWQRPGPNPKPSLELVVRQNEQVDADTIIFKSLIVFHMVGVRTAGTLPSISRTSDAKHCVR